jgi:hypothetical protein
METPTKANHQANIVHIEQVLPHPDPETTNLELIPIGEYQVVVRKGEFKVGDVGVYIQPDSVVPQTEPFEFIWRPYLEAQLSVPGACPHVDPATGPLTVVDGTKGEVCMMCGASNPFLVPEKKRRITVRKFRKEWSEGLLLPLKDFHLSYTDIPSVSVSVSEHSDPLGVEIVHVGDDVSDLIGVTHYVPESDGESTKADTAAGPKRKQKGGYPKTLKGWLRFLWRYFTSDKDLFEPVEVDFTIPTYDVESLKNYPNSFEDGEPVFVTEKIHGSNARYVYMDGAMYAGSHFQWKKINEGSVWGKVLTQHQWIGEWCVQHPGLALYGEVVPTQGKFNYGCKKDETKFFVFDVWDSNTNEWVHHTKWVELGIPDDARVPLLYVGPYSREQMQSLVDGPSTVPGANHAREGIVIKTNTPYRHVRGIGRLQLKLVSNAFLKKDSE